MTSSAGAPRLGTVDLVVVGAGIVGLAHAARAHAAGASVAIVERDARAVGASIRNFGHICITAQTDDVLAFGLCGRADWLRLAKEAGFWLRDAGTVVVARNAAERAVLEDFADARGDAVVLLDASGVRSRVPVADDVVGGAWLPLDLRVDPPEAVQAIAGWLAGQGVAIHWSTTVHGVEDGAVLTSRGVLSAPRVIVAVGHDVDQLYPEVAFAAGVRRCSLHMLSVANPSPATIEPAVLTGSSMLRYPGFAVSPALETVRHRMLATEPRIGERGLNLMFTQRPDGTLVIGDTHDYDEVVSPFSDEADDHLILTQAASLLGVPRLVVHRRWQGVYAAATRPFLIDTPRPGVGVVSVTSGIGMTTAFGLAAAHLPDLLG